MLFMQIACLEQAEVRPRGTAGWRGAASWAACCQSRKWIIDRNQFLGFLLQVAHLEQAEVRPRGAAGLAGRSFLGGLLPESLLYVLQTGGPGAFAAALAGDADTPELIWTHRMRGQRLVPQACAASTRF